MSRGPWTEATRPTSRSAVGRRRAHHCMGEGVGAAPKLCGLQMDRCFFLTGWAAAGDSDPTLPRHFQPHDMESGCPLWGRGGPGADHHATAAGPCSRVVMRGVGRAAMALSPGPTRPPEHFQGWPLPPGQAAATAPTLGSVTAARDQSKGHCIPTRGRLTSRLLESRGQEARQGEGTAAHAISSHLPSPRGAPDTGFGLV